MESFFFKFIKFPSIIQPFFSCLYLDLSKCSLYLVTVFLKVIVIRVKVNKVRMELIITVITFLIFLFFFWVKVSRPEDKQSRS